MSTIGERIKYLRTLSDLSQEELGSRVGVQRAAINKYEKGSVTNIPIATIEKLAVVFDVSPNYLVGWSDTSKDDLAAEVKVIQGVKTFFGRDSVELLELYTGLTPKGKKKLLEYAEDIFQLHQDNI